LVFYPTLAWNLLLGRCLRLRDWWTAIDEDIVLGALPFRSDVKRLKEMGITGVVNTCLEYSGPLNAYRECGIDQFYIPTIDFTHPKYEDVVRAVDFVENQVKMGGKVYVHCKAGRARSATIVMCWLVKSMQKPAAEIQRLLLAKRPHVNPNLYLRPVVQQFERQYLHQVH
jgi:atypical dual specificity phosphatase